MNKNSMDSFNRIYKKSNKVVSRKEGDEYILVPIEQNVGDMTKSITLKDVAAFVWENINGKNSLQEILDLIVEEYEIDIETAKTDLEEFIKEVDDMLS